MRNICVILMGSLFIILFFSCESDSNHNQKMVNEDTPTFINTIPDDGIYRVVEKMPCFPGCTESSSEKKRTCAQRKMLEFIYSNIEYPKLAREKGVEGTVVVRFVVSETGELLDIKCVRDIGSGCGNEAIRVVKLMPKWEPGLQQGVPVKVVFNIPVKFKLETEYENG